MADPFADNPSDDEAQTETPKTRTSTKKESTVTDAPAALSAPLEVSATLKGGSGFDAPWTVIRGASLVEVRDALQDEVLKEILELTQQAAKFYGSKYEGSAPAQRGGGGGGRQAPQGATESPDGRTESCEHGAMKYMSGVSKKSGKPYKMFVCQSGDRNNECKPVFVN
ncbi:hypothetical protein [Rhodococcus phage RGL3]|uniref:Uncharacterized protein n=1 Tax=Rhodococcus phage RGL3 TaxID=2922221 RepID=G9FHM6_9CAUD|nr:ribonucleoside reductase class II [Rhodococcus phage RGL3]AEV52114.1 hypothetical protein [Rhodococcus phage RGL3]